MINNLTSLNQKEAFRYLGYKGSKPDINIQRLMDELGEKLLRIICPRSIYKMFDLTWENGQPKVENAEIELIGESIKKHLVGCERVIFLAATLGKEADEYIKLLQQKEMTKAVMVDALASAAIEQVCDNVEIEIKEKLEKVYQDEKVYTTFRFSPGYGDLPLDMQMEFLNVLETQKKIGLNIVSDSMLMPTKSVTAIIGISKDTSQWRKAGCSNCNINQTCEFSKATKVK